MKPIDNFLRAGRAALALFVFTLFCAAAAHAQTTLLTTQTFSSSSFPPSGWSASEWYQSSAGDGGTGGSYGSAYEQMWDASGTLTTPAVNTSAYAVASDSVWVDFDFYWEYNYWCYENEGPDEFYVYANGSTTLLSGTESGMYTYYNNSDQGYGASGPEVTASSYWQHYHLLVPVASRNSSMSISFVASIGWGESNPAVTNVTITGKNKPPAELSFTPNPKKLNFGTATPGTPDTQYAIINSVGAAGTKLGISVAPFLVGSTAYSLLSGPGYAKVGDSIPSGSSEEVGIVFQPFSSGTLTAMLTVATSGADSGTQVISLTGIGAVPTVSYSTNKLFLGTETMLGTTAGPQYVYVNSTGVGPLVLSSIQVQGLNANNYVITHIPSGPIAPGGIDSIGVSFIPTIEGQPQASLVINSDAANIPFDTVQLLGIGLLPHIQVSYASSQAAGSSSITGSHSSDNVVEFDSVALGDSLCQQITISNPGSDTLAIERQLVTYYDFDFTYTPITGMDTLIPPGGSQTATICFKPLQQGTREANIRFFTNIPQTFATPRQDTSQVALDIIGVGVPFGNLTVTGPEWDTADVGGKAVCMTDTLMNTGQSSLTVTGVTIAGTTNTAWSPTLATPLTLNPGQRANVEFCFTAPAAGATSDNAAFSVFSNEQTTNVPWPINGFGAQSCVQTTPAFATFGGDSLTLVGKSDTTCITVTNCGNVPSNYVASMLGPGYILVSNSASGMIPANGTAQYCVAFTPQSIGAVAGTVLITGGPSTDTVVMGGVGAGVLAVGSGGPSEPVTIGRCDTFDVAVTNNGNIAWTPGTGTLGGPNAGDFTILSGPTPSVIPPNTSGTVVMEFCPTLSGAEWTSISFPNSSPQPIPGFAYQVNAVGTSESVAMKTSQDGFTLGQTFPNPMTGSADIALTLPNDAQVRIDLTDVTGNVVKTVFNGNLAAGDQIVPIDASGLPNGTYFYTLSSGDVRLTRELILLK